MVRKRTDKDKDGERKCDKGGEGTDKDGTRNRQGRRHPWEGTPLLPWVHPWEGTPLLAEKEEEEKDDEEGMEWRTIGW